MSMNIDATQTYLSLLSASATYAAQSGADGDEKKSTYAATSAAVAGATGQTNDNAVTGVIGSNLSKEMTAQLLSESQETSASNSNTEGYDGPLSIGERHHLEDIANDPGYAASQAKLFGTGGELVWAGKVLPGVNNGFSDAERHAFLAKQSSKMANEKQVSGERSAYYENLLKQGLPPAEIYAKLLEFNANLPDSHDATLGWSESGMSMSYSDYNKARLDYLQQIMPQTGAATPPDVPPTETVARDSSKFIELNFVSESDRKLLSAMTGYNVDEIGRFTDKNGKQAYPEDLTQHSLRTFQMDLLAARRGGTPDAIAGEHITASEFMNLINKSRAVASSMGERFNEELMVKGLAYIQGSNAA